LQGRTRKLATTVVVLALLVSVLSVGVLAVFTDSTSVGANTFATGDVDLSTSPTTALVTFSAMVPGDQVTAPITVTNDGSADLRYAISSTTTENPLAAQLDLTVKSGVATCTTAGFGASGSVLYGPADVGSTTGTNIVGNPAQGSQAGDRAVSAGANETLCFNVSLPLSTGNAFASLSSTATFTFQAEQTRNNP
jgi:predicted ribosomally synthesized peptide with SipW-like signal peptide